MFFIYSEFLMPSWLVLALIKIIALTLAYFPIVTFSGYFLAWVAKKCGDTTPETEGFLTFDPLVHASVISFSILAAVLLFGFPFLFGFGRIVPLDFRQVKKPYRKMKLGCILFARALATFFMAFLALFIGIFALHGDFAQFLVRHDYGNLLDALHVVQHNFFELAVIATVFYTYYGLFRLCAGFIYDQVSKEDSEYLFFLASIALMMTWYLANEVAHYIVVACFYPFYCLINYLL